MPRTTEQPLYLAVTVDVDADANRPVRGRPDAVSAGGAGSEARFEGCFEGLHALVDALDELSLPATLFWEARGLEQLVGRHAGLVRRLAEDDSLEHGCHGFRHEDFAGTESGLPLGAAETEAALGRAGDLIGAILGRAPRAFRAPYCRLTAELVGALSELGYLYDASVTRAPSARWRLRPYVLKDEPQLWELALCRSRDHTGKPISTYLWQLFEGNRPVQDYVDLVRQLRTDCAGGLLQIALHPWHLILDQDGAPLTRRVEPNPSDRLRRLLREVSRMDGVAFTTAGAYLDTIRSTS